MQLLFTTLALEGETLETGASRMASLPSTILHLCTRSISMENCSLLDPIVATLESGLKHALSSWMSMEYNPVAILEEQQISSCTDCLIPATPNTTLLAILSKGVDQ